MNRAEQERILRDSYRALSAAWGPQHWWPAESPFEVIVGAYLTQNTSWTNVERAVANLRAAGLLTIEGIRRVRRARLERLIRPSGYFRQKAQRLKTFVAFLDKRYGGSLDQLFSQPTDKLREELLALNGIGPETADSILLYAGNHAVFVVDAYTRRILERHRILPGSADYEEIRSLCERALQSLGQEQEQQQEHRKSQSLDRPESSAAVPAAVARATRPPLDGNFGARHSPSPMSLARRSPLAQLYNEMHGLIVGVGKHHCGKSQPKCDGCPLQPFLPSVK